MQPLKHLVIFLYVAELIAFSMLAARHGHRGRSLLNQPVAMLCAFMVLRLIVKMVYFYVEFYVLPWHLDIFYNALMDTTYVVSLAFCLQVVGSYAKVEIPRRRLFVVAAICYVALFSVISLLWVDRASNHSIVMENGFARAAYIANQAFFIVVALTTFASVWKAAAESEARMLALAICLAAGLYAIYVFIWDLSFAIPAIEGIHAIKPFDGVLVFGAALILIIVRLCPSEELAAAPQEETRAPEVDLEAFAAECGLTAREAEVLELLFQGKSTSQVAEELVISVNTAKRHTYNLYRKAGVSTRYELLYKVSHPGEAIPDLSGADDPE